jgi:hypothetical protein
MTWLPAAGRSSFNGQPSNGSTEWFSATSPAKIISIAPKIPSAVSATGASRCNEDRGCSTPSASAVRRVT